MIGMVKIDKKTYRFLGHLKHTNYRTYCYDISTLPQTGLDITPTASIYTFENDEVKLTVTFRSPLLLDDMVLFSRPVSYIEYTAELKGEHDFSLYFDVDAELEKPAFTKPGDVSTLGRHRLVCGDSTNPVTFDTLMNVYALFIDEIDAISKRDLLFINGMKQFRQYPIFGGTFFPQGEYVPRDWAELEAFSSFFPPRWHNTLVQIAASCGIVGLAAYVIHRIQTVRLFLRHRNTENLFIAIYIVALLVAGLLDNHFFNVGPVLVYSMALAFAENIDQSKV
jgi:hypothetical protein